MAAPKNTANRWSEKEWRNAIRIAVNEKIGSHKKLRLLASKLIENGLAGDSAALKEIGDRLDGKPSQSLEVAVTDERNVIRSPAPADTPADWAQTYTPKPH